MRIGGCLLVRSGPRCAFVATAQKGSWTLGVNGAALRRIERLIARQCFG